MPLLECNSDTWLDTFGSTLFCLRSCHVALIAVFVDLHSFALFLDVQVSADKKHASKSRLNLCEWRK
jgi:hypothetical protein